MNNVAREEEPTKRNWISFWSLLTLQSQNAFNDKSAQFLLIPLAALLSLQATEAGQDIGFLGRNMTYVLGALMVLPFILFAPLAGWISDRCSKTMVIRYTLCLQFIVLLWLAGAVWLKSLPLAVVGFFLLSVESVLLSPAKKGITKELVGTRHLGFASGVLEMAVILAVCAGQIISGWWYDARLESGAGAWDAAFFPLTLISAGAFLSLGVSLLVQRVPAMSRRPFKAKIFVEHFGQLKEVWQNRKIRLSGVGVSFFWGFAGFINLVAIQIGKDLSGGGGEGFASENSWLMLAASGGIALGGVIASLICRRKIELGLVPLGGLIMVVGSLALGMGPIERDWVMVWLAIAGGGGAFLLVPLNAYLQDECPADCRGKILAGLNLLDCMAGLLAVVIQFAMSHFGVSYFWQFVFLAVLSLAVVMYSARLLPQQLASFVILAFFRMVYRVRVLHGERFPKKGGVLLLANHVSYIDAFILSAACPRPIQFLLFDEFFENRWVGRVARFFDTIPISKTKAKEGIKLASQALEEGKIICIFPEGELTRTGAMQKFERGYEMIARRGKSPVLPAALDGVWGSIFSFERNRFLGKKPYSLQYGVTVNFGALIPAREADAETVRSCVEKLRAESFATRAILQNPQRILKKTVEVLADAQQEAIYRKKEAECLGLPDAELVELVANAMQMGELNAIRRDQTVMLEMDALEKRKCLDVVAFILPRFLDLKVVPVSDALLRGERVRDVVELIENQQVEVLLGGEGMVEARKALHKSSPDSEVVCYDFCESAIERLQSNELEGATVIFPCFTQDGRVISMSMPHPPIQNKINDPQDGYCPGTWGYVLPAFEIESDGAGVMVKGVSTGMRGIRLSGASVTSEGMLKFSKV